MSHDQRGSARTSHERNARMSATRMSHIRAGITGRLRGECTMTNAPAIARMGDHGWPGVRHPT